MATTTVTVESNSYIAQCSECCQDPVTCIVGCFCPCVIFGMNSQKGLGENFLLCCLGYAVAQFFTGCLGTALCGVMFRSKFRPIYQLRPDNDCLCHCCCVPCALTQDSREIQIRKQQAPVATVVVPQQQTMK